MNRAVPLDPPMHNDVGDDALAGAAARAERAERVLDLVQELHASLELTDVVDNVAKAAQSVVGRPAVLWLVDGDRARAVGRSAGAMIGVGEERPLPAEAAERMVAESHRFQREGERARPRLEGRRLIVPLLLDERLLGFIAAGPWDDTPPEQGHALMLHSLAPHAASAVQNARRHADMLRLSLTDSLVQLPNRRQLDFFLEMEFNAAQRGRPLCFVLFDLDHFKSYNDTHGHRAGDLALIEFANVLRHETRSMNLAARYGGEEFAAVLSSTAMVGARAYAERVRRRVELVFQGSLTVSGGAVEYSPRYASPTELVVAADRALYEAKLQGRNRICIADA